MKKEKQKPKHKNLSSEDMTEGFKEIERYQVSEYELRKRKLGVAPGKQILIKWK